MVWKAIIGLIIQAIIMEPMMTNTVVQNKQCMGSLSDGDIYLTDLLTQSACDYIEKNSDTPFFLYLSYNAPQPSAGEAFS